MLIVTSISASLLTIIYLKLAFNVISLREKNKVSLGSGGFSDLEKAIRAHGNFSEYVPLGLILMACIELNGAPWWYVTLLGTTLTVGRIFHAMGIQEEAPNFNNRIIGINLTFISLAVLVVSNLGWSIFKLI